MKDVIAAVDAAARREAEAVEEGRKAVEEMGAGKWKALALRELEAKERHAEEKAEEARKLRE